MNLITRTPRLVRNAMVLMISTGGAAILGIAFWAVAAHLYSPSTIGRGSAELSAMTLLAQIAQLNLASAFLRLLPRAGLGTRTIVLVGYAATSVLGLALAIIFIASPLSNGVIPSSVAFAASFAVAVTLWTIFVVQDGVLTGLRQAPWVPVENISFGALKVVLLPLLALALPTQGVFFAWTLPVVLAVGIVSVLLFRHVIPSRMADADSDAEPFKLPPPRALASFFGAEYSASIVSALGTFLLPLIIVTRLGPTANAHFYIPWIAGVAVWNLQSNIAASFIVEAVHDEEPFRVLFWHTMRLMLGLTAAGLFLTIVTGPALLGLLAPSYVHSGSTLLRWIGLSFPFSVVTAMFMASLWMKRSFWTLAAYQGAQTAVLIALTYVLLGSYGINAAGIARLVATGAAGLAVLPSLIRWYRQHATVLPAHDDRSITSE
jgi:O-antigen/teichoic acid export membrane protein